METIVLNISKKTKQEPIDIAHKKGMALNEFIRLLVLNRIS